MKDVRPGAEQARGRLKLFVSYAPGAGKTYAMLTAALRARARGVDVAAGRVEPNGRADTARLLAALERQCGPALEKDGELDLDGAVSGCYGGAYGGIRRLCHAQCAAD